MKKVLVSLTGGCESVALLSHALEQECDVTAIHFEFSNASRQESSTCKTICNKMGIPYIHSVYNDHITTGRTVVDIVQWTGLLATAAAKLQPDEVWFGAHSQDRLEILGRIYSAFEMMMSLRSKEAISQKVPVISAPLCNIHKSNQYRMIPVDIRPHIVYCFEDKNNPCGDCPKCVEWNKFVYEQM